MVWSVWPNWAIYRHLGNILKARNDYFCDPNCPQFFFFLTKTAFLTFWQLFWHCSTFISNFWSPWSGLIIISAKTLASLHATKKFQLNSPLKSFCKILEDRSSVRKCLVNPLLERLPKVVAVPRSTLSPVQTWVIGCVKRSRYNLFGLDEFFKCNKQN